MKVTPSRLQNLEKTLVLILTTRVHFKRFKKLFIVRILVGLFLSLISQEALFLTSNSGHIKLSKFWRQCLKQVNSINMYSLLLISILLLSSSEMQMHKLLEGLAISI